MSGEGLAAAVGVRPSRRTALSRVGSLFPTPTAKIGAAVLAAHVVLALVGAIWNPPATEISGTIRSAPSLDHLLGTDRLGRDVLRRMIAGSDNLIGISLAVALASTTVGSALGALVAYRGGLFDLITMRVVDLFMAFPIIVVALLAAALLPAGYLSIFIVVVAVHVPPVTRVARAVFADNLARDYVTVARLRGESFASVTVREALPNAAGPLLVEFALRWIFAVILIASLNFLGVGVQPPTPDWGLMLFEARDDLLIAPWAAVVPAVALASLAVAINFVADGLSTAFAQRADVLRQMR